MTGSERLAIICNTIGRRYNPRPKIDQSEGRYFTSSSGWALTTFSVAGQTFIRFRKLILEHLQAEFLIRQKLKNTQGKVPTLVKRQEMCLGIHYLKPSQWVFMPKGKKTADGASLRKLVFAVSYLFSQELHDVGGSLILAAECLHDSIRSLRVPRFDRPICLEASK